MWPTVTGVHVSVCVLQVRIAGAKGNKTQTLYTTDSYVVSLAARWVHFVLHAPTLYTCPTPCPCPTPCACPAPVPLLRALFQDMLMELW